MQTSIKTQTLVASLDAKLNARAGWGANHLAGHLHLLTEFGRVEVGWRSSCGSTDQTAHIKRAWDRVVAALGKDGFRISVTPVKHGNAYATCKGGFWNSNIYEMRHSA